MRKILFFCFLFIFSNVIRAQNLNPDFKKKTFTVKKDTIQLDSVSINSQEFRVLDSILQLIPKQNYSVDFNRSQLFINAKKYPKVTVAYFRFPEFITKTYSPFDEKLIQPNEINTGVLYSLTSNKKIGDKKIFDGLATKGFILRGLTSGNNQNAVTNSQLDLELSGKLSPEVAISARIFDTNIPIQQNGYSQNLTDFNQIYVALTHKDWQLRAGDISIFNQKSYFMPLNKQISGLRVQANIHKNLKTAATGAMVRGKFNSFRVPITEGNQGPYKIFGIQNEANILIVEGSEQVYVNGVQIKRGEDKDYTIDYNLAELSFNTTFPITNDIRVIIEFQYADRNYTRFLTYEELNYQNKKLNINAYFYSENDAKNQPIQQNLTNDQKTFLANAGDDQNLMIAETAFPTNFDLNKIQYKKITADGISLFEYSTDPSDQLFSVTFTNVGQNKGDYTIKESSALGIIYTYVGKNIGNYSPKNQLVAPNRFQTFVVQSNYTPNKKTNLSTEIALSNNDRNLFSSIDDSDNTAIASLLNWQQILIDKKWKLQSTINNEFVQKNFNTEVGWEPIEFNRNWNILTNFATKNLFSSELKLQNDEKSFTFYKYSNLNYPNIYNGNKHEFNSKLQLHKTSFFAKTSFLDNTSTLEDNTFLIAVARAEHSFKKSWFGAFTNIENNSRKNKITKEFVATSHRFKAFETYFAIGDSTKVFTKIGLNFKTNDSVKKNKFEEINNRRTIYIKSKLIKNKTSNLSLYANYRDTQNNFMENEKSLNSKIIFNKKLFDNFINLATSFESTSGNIAQQEFVYIKTEQGQGFYTWIDYDNDGVEDFDEFEIAEFQDQASYLRLPLPNLRFIATQRAKFTKNLTINCTQWKVKKGFKRVLSHFINKSFLVVDNEQKRSGDSFNFNPFNFNDDKLVGLNFNFRNTLFFNRNLQRYSTNFTLGNSRNKQQFFIGSQERSIHLQQIDFSHKFAHFWLAELLLKNSKNELKTKNFNNRNFNIHNQEIQPKISFLYSNNNRFAAYYHYKAKENQQADFERLQQQKIGLEYYYNNQEKYQISANFTMFLNDFIGNSISPVAYQMLEGLQTGRNYTWNIVFNKKINSFLSFNLNYLGRTSENSKRIHTGNIQLKAFF